MVFLTMSPTGLLLIHGPFIRKSEGESVARNDKQVAFRLPAELVDELDRKAEDMSSSVPGMRVTRADIVRALLVQGLGTTANQDTMPASSPTSRRTARAPQGWGLNNVLPSLSMDED